MIRLDAKSGIAFSGRALLYFQKRELDRAIADYTQAIKLEPGIAGNLTGRGYAYHAKGQYDQAIADYDTAIRIKPDYVVAYHDRGFAYFAKGEMTRAIFDYSEAIRLDQEKLRHGERTPRAFLPKPPRISICQRGRDQSSATF